MNNDPLYQLIKALNGTEKRYFKLYANKQEGKKDYVDLFNFIDKEKDYNEAKLKAAFKDRDFIKHIAVVKNYLFNAIIDSLHEFSTYDTTIYKIEEQLKKIQVLYQKGLIDISIKYIEKAKKLAEDNECFSELIKLLEIQQQISLRNSSHLFSKRKEIQTELKQAVEKFYNLNAYSQLRLEVNSLLYGDGEKAFTISQLQQHPLLSDPSKALSSKAMEFYYRMHSTINEQSGKIAEANAYTLKLLKIYESKPTILNENPLMYARAINSYLQLSFGLRDFSHYDHYLSVLLNLEKLKISSEEKSVIKGIYYLNLLIKNVEYGAFSDSINIASKIERDILTNILVPVKIRFGILHQLFIAYFGDEKYKEALKLVNTSLTTNDNIIPLLKRASKLFALLTLYELGYVEQLENELSSLERKLPTLTNSDGEKILVKYLRKIIHSKEKTEQLNHFKELQKNFIALIESPEKATILQLFDFVSWIEAKINNASFATIVRKKNSQFYTENK